MKRGIIISAIAVSALFLAGCRGKDVSWSGDVEKPSIMTLVERTGYYSILVDTATRVMYIENIGSDGGIAVMVNADGTPRIWKEEMKDQ